jgi:hypothetical protein
MEMVLAMWLSNLGSVDLGDPLASKSNLSVEEDTKMAKGHAVCRNLKGEGVMTVAWIENWKRAKECLRWLQLII